MAELVRHRQTKGSATDRLHLNHRATPRLHTNSLGLPKMLQAQSSREIKSHASLHEIGEKSSEIVPLGAASRGIELDSRYIQISRFAATKRWVTMAGTKECVAPEHLRPRLTRSFRGFASVYQLLTLLVQSVSRTTDSVSACNPLEVLVAESSYFSGPSSRRGAMRVMSPRNV